MNLDYVTVGSCGSYLINPLDSIFPFYDTSNEYLVDFTWLNVFVDECENECENVHIEMNILDKTRTELLDDNGTIAMDFDFNINGNFPTHLSLKVMLEGAYNQETNKMNTILQESELLPTTPTL